MELTIVNTIAEEMMWHKSEVKLGSVKERGYDFYKISVPALPHAGTYTRSTYIRLKRFV